MIECIVTTTDTLAHAPKRVLTSVPVRFETVPRVGEGIVIDGTEYVVLRVVHTAGVHDATELFIC